MTTKVNRIENFDAAIAAQVESEMKRELATRRGDLASKLRHEATLRHLRKVNARHPIEGPMAGLTPAQHAARLKAMDEGAQRDREKMARANARPPAEAVTTDRGPRMRVSGSEGLRIKTGGR